MDTKSSTKRCKWGATVSFNNQEGKMSYRTVEKKRVAQSNNSNEEMMVLPLSEQRQQTLREWEELEKEDKEYIYMRQKETQQTNYGRVLVQMSGTGWPSIQ